MSVEIPDDTWTVAVEVPIRLPAEERHSLFSAIAAAVSEWEPDDRDGWDADVTGYPTADPPRRAEPAEECGDLRPALLGEPERRCTLPAGHNLHRKGGNAWEQFRAACSCDGDPIECSHEAARGVAEAAVARVRFLSELTIASSIRVQAIDQARDTLAALDRHGDGTARTVITTDALHQLVRVAAHVSRGRRAADIAPYPDALARKALGALDDATLRTALDQREGA